MEEITAKAVFVPIPNIKPLSNLTIQKRGKVPAKKYKDEMTAIPATPKSSIPLYLAIVVYHPANSLAPMAPIMNILAANPACEFVTPKDSSANPEVVVINAIKLALMRKLIQVTSK